MSRDKHDGAHQQRATAVQLRQQYAPVVEEVGGLDVAVQVSDSRGQPRVQLGVHVELPRIARLLDLAAESTQNTMIGLGSGAPLSLT